MPPQTSSSGLTPALIASFNKISGLNVPASAASVPQASQSRADEIRAMGQKNSNAAPVQPAIPAQATPPVVSNPLADTTKAGAQVTADITGENAGAGVGQQGSLQEGVRAASDAASAIPSTVADVIPFGKDALGAAGKVLTAATDTAGNIGNILASLTQKIGLMSPEQRAKYDKANQDFANSDAGQNVTNVADTLNNLGNIANIILGAKGGADAAQTAVDTVPKIIGTPPGPDGTGGTGIKGTAARVKTALTPSVSTPEEQAASRAQARQAADQTIVKKYTQAIKPTITGQKTAGARDAYNSNVVTAIRTIEQNKGTLSFKDESGNTETGRTPETPAELSNAVAQTKGSIFKQYDAQAKAAGDAGAKVDSKPIGDELDQVINSEALKLTNPEAVRYARGVQGRLIDSTDEEGSPTYKQYNTETAQDIVKNYNSSLDAFYNNPSYTTATKAAIDARVATKFREGLDEAINSSTGENYSALKKAYGALSSIEKDVTKRGIVLARQAPGGLGKYIDMFGEGNMLDGLLELSPAKVASGALKVGINHLYQYYNSPDRAIKGMFDAVAKTR